MGGKTKKVELAPLVLNERNLPYVESLLHLRHTLTADAKIDKDVDIKRFTYISKCNEVKDNNHFLHPRELQELILSYCSSFYGSNILDYETMGAKKIFSQ